MEGMLDGTRASVTRRQNTCLQKSDAQLFPLQPKMNKSSIFREISKRHMIRSSTDIPVGLLFLLTVLGLIFILFVVVLIRYIRVKSSNSFASSLMQDPHCGPYIIPVDSPPSYEDIVKETRIAESFQPLPPTYEQSLNLPKSTIRDCS